ncbi:MAG: N-acetyltransferase [Clostridiales bacterium]|nr:N-acetyltransferase [Clostridiales bacterium]
MTDDSTDIVIKRVDSSNFNMDSLRDFDRYQVVTEVYRPVDGELKLIPLYFTETWSDERKKEKAAEILSSEFIVYGAFDGDHIAGEIMLVPKLNKNRLIVDSFHVSRDQRRRGIGRMLIETVKEEAKKMGASALYMSCCSAKETIDFYTAMGCRPSADPIRKYAEDEPCDIQMELPLND